MWLENPIRHLNTKISLHKASKTFRSKALPRQSPQSDSNLPNPSIAIVEIPQETVNLETWDSICVPTGDSLEARDQQQIFRTTGFQINVFFLS